jgi:hypothetical protein
MLVKSRKAQSILEYALLIAVVVAAILVMQVFVKRGFQGQLKDSAGRMGEQFSATETTTKQRVVSEASGITESTGVNANSPIAKIGGDADGVSAAGVAVDAQDTMSHNAFSVTTRTGGNQTVTSGSRTDSASAEVNKMNYTSLHDVDANYITAHGDSIDNTVVADDNFFTN